MTWTIHKSNKILHCIKLHCKTDYCNLKTTECNCKIAIKVTFGAWLEFYFSKLEKKNNIVDLSGPSSNIFSFLKINSPLQYDAIGWWICGAFVLNRWYQIYVTMNLSGKIAFRRKADQMGFLCKLILILIFIDFYFATLFDECIDQKQSNFNLLNWNRSDFKK